MLKRKALALALLLPAVPAMASEVYVSLGTTQTSMDASVSGSGIYAGGGSVDIDMENGLSFGFGFREGEANRRYLVRIQQYGIGGWSGDASLDVYDLGADFLFGSSSAPLRPYVGGTLGYANFDADDGFLPLGSGDSDGGAIGGVAAGVIWDINRYLFAELRAEHQFINRSVDVRSNAPAGQAAVSIDATTSGALSLAFRF